MKKEDITYQDKINELRLDLSHPNNKGITFIFLEGKSDIRLYRKLFILDNCKVETIPGGNLKLEECVSTLKELYPLIIGIRDADFINLNNNAYSKANMFLTDCHDIEMMLIFEKEVFSSLIFEYTLINVEKHIEIRNNIFSIIEKISLLKWLNDLENLEYKFGAGFQDLISLENLDINFSEYFSRIISDSTNSKLLDISLVIQKLDTLKQSNPNPFQLCNGHDFIKALSKFIREKDIKKNKSINDKIISSSLRMIYSITMFKRTNLYQSIKSWADYNNCVLFS